MPWEVTSSRHFAESSHINLQEAREIICMLKRRCRFSILGKRGVNVSESNVSIFAWAKGRSSSYVLNGLLRIAMAWPLM